MIRAVTDATFADDVLASTTPVLLEVGAEWCPPCRALAPILAEIAGERAARLRVVTMDWDESPRVAQGLGVMAVPTLFLFAKGEALRRWAGYSSKRRLLMMLDEALAESAAAAGRIAASASASSARRGTAPGV